MMPEIRPGKTRDLEHIAAIQAASPEAAQWDVSEYLQYELRVASIGGRVAGFVVWRKAGDECEILNLAVAPEFRRQGLGKQLIQSLVVEAISSTVFLEVRASNQVAQDFYKCLEFQEVGRRPDYYSNPSEAAIVMKFHSC